MVLTVFSNRGKNDGEESEEGSFEKEGGIDVTGGKATEVHVSEHAK